MNDDRVLIKFSCGDYEVEGLSPVGVTLTNALKAIGARQFVESNAETDEIRMVKVTLGRDLLISIDPASENSTSFDEFDPNKTRLDQAGTIEVKMEINTEADTAIDPNDEIVKRIIRDFESLPLEKKVVALAGMELNTLGETASFVFNSPFELFGKVGDVLADLGIKKDAADHRERTGVTEPPVDKDTNDGKDDELVN